MNILNDDRLLIINYVGVFLFFLKVVGFSVTIGYWWLLSIAIWQIVVMAAGAAAFLSVLLVGFLISTIDDVYYDVKRSIKVCKVFGHKMYSNTDNVAGKSTCKRCGHEDPAVKWPRE